ncbi:MULTISPECIES: hypothetical protein [unclassified Thioalkalivibrio]|uniref:hypothetical protein n=1 Tax=unclassified Thioalkalivibrio TaxID=2621013 RepID=UPI000369BACF|nr:MULTISPECIES: hypothetical protein [unclassified Thioalkalivibrio]
MKSLYRYGVSGALAATAAALPSTAFAQSGNTGGLVGIFNNLIELFQGLGMAAVALAFVVGIIFFVIGFFTLKSMGGRGAQEPGKLGLVVVYFAAGVGLIYLGYMIQVGGDTMFGGDQSQSGSIEDGAFGL